MIFVYNLLIFQVSEFLKSAADIATLGSIVKNTIFMNGGGLTVWKDFDFVRRDKIQWQECQDLWQVFYSKIGLR